MRKTIRVKKQEIIDALYYRFPGFGLTADEIGVELGYVSHRPVRAALIELMAAGVVFTSWAKKGQPDQYVVYILTPAARLTIIDGFEPQPIDWDDQINWAQSWGYAE